MINQSVKEDNQASHLIQKILYKFGVFSCIMMIINNICSVYKFINFMLTIEQQPKLRSLSIQVDHPKGMHKRRYPKNAESEVIPRRTELKIIRLDEQIISSPTAANVINLEFADDAPGLFKRNHRKTNKKFNCINQEKRSAFQRQFCKSRYHELFKQSLEYFYKNTIQIGPCAKSIIKQNELNDAYARRKLINIQKLSFPLRQIKRELTARYKYKTLINKTSSSNIKHQNYSSKQRNKSVVSPNQYKSHKASLNVSSNCVQNATLISKQEIKQEYKNQIATLLPIRKPYNKKDYFVFGLSDRNNTNQNKLQIYRDLLWKINYSNGMFVYTPPLLNAPYKFYVGEGNNSNLIRGILRRRFWWTQASSKNQQGVNFVWSQLKINTFFQNQDNGLIPQYFVVERIQSEIARSDTPIYDSQAQYDNHKKIFGRIDYKIWKNHLSKNQKTEKKITDNTYQKRIKMYEKKQITKIQDSHQLKMHNHLQQNYYIGNKKALFYNVKRYLELKKEDPFKMLPLTFHITKGMEDPQYEKFIKYYKHFQQERKDKKNNRNIWIVKPGQNTNRGNGISVCYSIDDIKHRLRGRQRNSDGKLRTFILQKYIENPLLYNKRKFDIRHYLLITCINGSFKGYWFQQGYVRTSSAEYNIKSTKDPLIHLTNDAIQKHTPEYGKFQKANKLSYSQLQKYMETTYPSKSKANFTEVILPKMKFFATEAVRATYSILDSNRKKHNFELLGLDFMIDEHFQPWLIEVNTNPCLQLCCPHLSKIIPSVIENMFKICLDPLFPPPQAWPNNRKPFFGEDSLNDNRFQIIFDQASDGKQIERLYNGVNKIDSQMGKIQQDNETFENEGEVEWQKAQ